MAEIEVDARAKAWHEGGKTYMGVIVMAIPVLAGFLGYDVAELFPIEAARFTEEAFILIGGALAFYGRWHAKVPAWFSKINKA